MEFLKEFLTIIFAFFIAFLVVGFNRQMIQRAKEREEKFNKKGEKMSKKILVPLARGFEEAEFIGIADVLKRAAELDKSLEVVLASLDEELLVKGANGISIKADLSLSKLDTIKLDAIALPGGFDGMNNLKNNATILNIIKDLHAKGKLVAAICASPIVLDVAGVLEGEFTCYPGCELGLKGKRVQKAVNINKNVITSAGPATAILFGLELVKTLCGEEIYKALYDGLQVPLTK